MMASPAATRRSGSQQPGHDWPGNIRELRNVLERAMILETTATLHVLPPAVTAISDGSSSPPAPDGAAPARGLHDMERDHILRVLRQTGWRIRGKHGAAETLSLKPTTLEKRMARLGIERPSARR